MAQITNWDFLQPDLKYILACSGGPDSMFLLYLAMQKINAKNLTVCHVNYHKRSDSNVDQHVVEKFCLQNGIKFMVKHAIGDSTNQNKVKNFQAWARQVRYDFFCQTAKNVNGVILVAHNLNDFAETYVIQKQRKALPQYYGIQYCHQYYSNGEAFMVYRPLLNWLKKDILLELQKHNIPYAVDSSNESNLYLRNRIRKSLTTQQIKHIRKQAAELNQSLELSVSQISAAIEGKYISWAKYDKLNNQDKARCIYMFLDQNLHNVLQSKKSKIVTEIVKQFNSSKKDHAITLNKDWELRKHRNQIFLTSN